ncbi:uncharacterized protein LOC132736814 [Ruditapes philippinarum]|uniref:uncharacterized protein LOC132736814 n=1 Tax=Ruditapes philippinarum TaxID=129788 RepID=UPI00295AFD00|nr:uncharacterized protein LOC132736814 [Ruditapes philippinarum]
MSDVAASNKYDDPDSVDKCYPLPTESSNFLSFDGEFIYQELIEMVKKARNYPKKFKKNSKGGICRKLFNIKPDMRRYYWQISCPYEVFWLGKFTWRFRTNLRYTETCYIVQPCLQQVRIVNCTSHFCDQRFRSPFCKVNNSICLENNFIPKRVLVFCIKTYRTVRGKVEQVNCSKTPHLCLKWVTIRVPQTCECWHCWDMFRTDPKMIPFYQKQQIGAV